MNYIPFITYVILIIISYIYDFFGNGINKMNFSPSDKGYATFAIVWNIMFGIIIYYTCYIGYELLPWILTILTFLSTISVICLNLVNIKIEYNSVENENEETPQNNK